MKRIIIISAVALFGFVLGWWANEMYRFAEGVVADAKRLDRLKKNNPLLYDSSKIKTFTLPEKKTLRDYISDDHFIHWAPIHSDAASYLCEITLHDKTVLYWYHGQCGYDYFTDLTSDTTIEVLWSYRADCILNMDFLEQSNGAKKYPKPRDNFATLTLVNDTTLKVSYNFPEWIKKVNQTAKDSIFPTYYYLNKDN